VSEIAVSETFLVILVGRRRWGKTRFTRLPSSFGGLAALWVLYNHQLKIPGSLRPPGPPRLGKIGAQEIGVEIGPNCAMTYYNNCSNLLSSSFIICNEFDLFTLSSLSHEKLLLNANPLNDFTREHPTYVIPRLVSPFPISKITLFGVRPWDLCIVIAQQIVTCFEIDRQ
jgi:hypothetical protein